MSQAIDSISTTILNLFLLCIIQRLIAQAQIQIKKQQKQKNILVLNKSKYVIGVLNVFFLIIILGILVFFLHNLYYPFLFPWVIQIENEFIYRYIYILIHKILYKIPRQKIIIKKIYQHKKMQKSPDQKTCKIHTQKKGQFYIQNQPWNKLCRQCALNRAVCGYKIQKQLSAQEYQNKIILGSVVQELKVMVDICQKQSNVCSMKVQKIRNQLIAQISPVITHINEHISQLTTLRNSILELNDNLITKKINKLQENQSKYFMQSITFKKYLQNLQDNYCDIIIERDQNGEDNFKKQAQIMKVQVDKIRKFINLEEGVSQEENNKIRMEFQCKFKQFAQKACNFQLGKRILEEIPIKQNIQANNPLNQFLTKQKIKITVMSDKKPLTSRRKLSNFSSTIFQQELQQFSTSSKSKSKPNLTLKSKRNSSIKEDRNCQMNRTNSRLGFNTRL